MRSALLGLSLCLALAACGIFPAATAPAAPAASPTAPAETAAVTASPEPVEPTPSPEPSPFPTSTPDCRQQPGTLERAAVPSALLGKEIPMQVYLPACPAPAEGYPSLYLLHGQGGSAEQWPGMGLAERMDERTAAGGQPFLVIMPQEDEYLAEPADSAYAEAVADELLPWVSARFPACEQRACRAVGGLSRGAAWAVRLGFSRPDLFGAVGAHSLPVFYGDMSRLPTWLAEMPAGEPPALYLDIGSADRYLSPAAEFEALLVTLRLPHEWHLNDGGHEDAYWAAHLPEYLDWYASVLGK